MPSALRPHVNSQSDTWFCCRAMLLQPVDYNERETRILSDLLSIQVCLHTQSLAAYNQYPLRAYTCHFICHFTRDSPKRLTGDKTTAGVRVAQMPHVALSLILNFAKRYPDCLCMFVLREICAEVSAKFANVLVEWAASNPSAAEQLKPSFSVSDSAHICGLKRCHDHLNDKIVTAINVHSLKQALFVIDVLQATSTAFQGILDQLERSLYSLDYPRLQANFNTFVALHSLQAVSWSTHASRRSQTTILQGPARIFGSR
jgi:hypothetical protein